MLPFIFCSVPLQMSGTIKKQANPNCNLAQWYKHLDKKLPKLLRSRTTNQERQDSSEI